MARALDLRTLYSYRFGADFRSNDGRLVELDHGFAKMATTPLGFEVWTGATPGSVLMSKLQEATYVEVTMYAKDEGDDSRVIKLAISKPEYLPIDLDAMDSSVALEGVVFLDFKILGITDEPRSWPPVAGRSVIALHDPTS